MNEQKNCASLRSEFGRLGLVLLLYYGIMNVVVTVVAAVDAFIRIMAQPGSGMEAAVESVIQAVVNNGWGYILASLLGAVLLLIWKKRQFCLVEIWKPGKEMKPGSFCMLLCLFISAQAVFQLLVMAMEAFFNLFGMSVMESVESASITGDTLSMFLYITLVAPVFEEILFRGLILRSLEPYGKKFAILASAFLFGIFHGNIVQSPFAFLVGLVLGYVTVEYSMGWAMVLHMINNLVLGDSLNRITQLFPSGVGDLVFFVIVWGCSLASVLILVVKRRQIGEYLKNGRIHPICLKSFFTAPGILLLTGIMMANILLTLFLSMLSS